MNVVKAGNFFHVYASSPTRNRLICGKFTRNKLTAAFSWAQDIGVIMKKVCHGLYFIRSLKEFSTSLNTNNFLLMRFS